MLFSVRSKPKASGAKWLSYTESDGALSLHSSLATSPSARQPPPGTVSPRRPVVQGVAKRQENDGTGNVP
eukprot:2212534-Pyramimonas_sp.AAC.1